MPDTARSFEAFPLRILNPLSPTYQPPEGRFDPAGEWELEYGIYSLSGMSAPRPMPSGRLRLSRRKGPQPELVVDYVKQLTEGEQRVRATAKIAEDRLGTPSEWEWRTSVHRADGSAIDDLAFSRTGKSKGGEIHFTGTGKAFSMRRPDRLALNWGLFEAVQRLPRKQFEPLRFTMLDHFDYLKPGQTLRYRETLAVPVSGDLIKEMQWEQLEKGRLGLERDVLKNRTQLTLHAYEQLGQATLPWVYYVDDAGRCSFVISGIEAYVLGAPQAART